MYGTIHFSKYNDLDGNPIERDPEKYPYSYEPFVTYKLGYSKTDHVVYSDRLYQWDYNKYNNAAEQAFANGRKDMFNNNPKDIEKFLQIYLEDKSIVLTAIMHGANMSDGYPYWIFFYKQKN